MADVDQTMMKVQRILTGPMNLRIQLQLLVLEEQGGNYFFGHVTVQDDSNNPGKLFLMMSHTLLGDYLDEGELSGALYAMLGTADRLDDELKGKFGGKRLADH